MPEIVPTALSEIVEIQQGRYLSKEEMAEKASAEFPVPVHGANGIIGWTSEPMYSEGLPLVTCRGSNSGMVLWANGPLWVSNNAMAILPRSGSNRFLLYSLINAPPYSVVTGSAQPQITRRDLVGHKIAWTSPPMQEAIASVLGALDDKIELNRRMNETLEAMARAIFRDWFVDFGPTRAKMEGRAPYLAPDIWSLFPDSLDDEGKPEGWCLGTLGDVAQQVGESVKPEALDPGTPYIGLEHMPRKSIALSDWDGAGKVSSGKLAFCKGDFLFGKLRPYFHKVGIAPVDGICSTDIVVLNSRKREAAAFVLACISQDEFVAFTDRTSDGTKMPRTSWGRMERYSLYIPNQTVLKSFNDCIEPMLERIVANIHESRTLAATRDLLLPKLMSGEIRVKDAEKLAGQVT